jgi:hypothetical protein
MPKAFIKIAYKQLIDATSQSIFEKDILHYSFEEYRMKQQTYNTDGLITRFSALKAKDGRANSLHYKSGFAVAGIIDALKNNITVLQDGAEQNFVFDSYRFEVIESDISNESLHAVAIHYISSTLILYEIIGNYLLLGKGDKNAENIAEPAETFLIKVQSGMTIVSYNEIKK